MKRSIEALLKMSIGAKTTSWSNTKPIWLCIGTLEVHLLLFCAIGLFGCSKGSSANVSNPQDGVLSATLLGTWRCENESGFETYTFLSDATWLSHSDLKGDGAVRFFNALLGEPGAIIGKGDTEGTWKIKDGQVLVTITKATLSTPTGTKPLEKAVGLSGPLDVSDLTNDHFYRKQERKSPDEPLKVDVFTRVH